MTKIEVHYVNGDGIVYHVVEPVVADRTYYVNPTYIEFKTVQARTLVTEDGLTKMVAAHIMVPFNNVISIKIWEESDKANEGKDKRH